METALTILDLLRNAVVQLFVQPFYYIAILFIILQYTRQMKLERQLFAVKLHDWKPLVMKAILFGLLVGVSLSMVGAFLGTVVTIDAILWLWIIAVMLLVIRVRFLCFAYSAGIIVILQWVVGFTNLAERGDWLGTLGSSLSSLDAAGLLLLVALLHLAEAALVRWQGTQLSTPLFLESKRGKLVGGYRLQGFWPVPLFLFVPLTGGAMDGQETVSLAWYTLLSGSNTQSWTIMALPMIIGFTEITRSMLPEEKAKQASKSLFLYSMILTVAAIGAWWQPVLLPVVGLLAIGLHEAITWRSIYRESTHKPLFVHDERGLKLLGIVPGSPAETMGLRTGEILYKVNGIRVKDKEELYESLVLNPAFCKLELLNNEGEIKFAQRARYAGEHHQLGVILAPDEQANFYASQAPVTLLELIRGRKASNRRGGPTVELTEDQVHV